MGESKIPVEVFRSTNCNQTVCIGQLGEHANFIIILELDANCHLS